MPALQTSDPDKSSAQPAKRSFKTFWRCKTDCFGTMLFCATLIGIVLGTIHIAFAQDRGDAFLQVLGYSAAPFSIFLLWIVLRLLRW